MIWKQCYEDLKSYADIALSQPGKAREMLIAFADICDEKGIEIDDCVDIIYRMSEIEKLFEN